MAEPTVLIVPGLRDAVAGHWQTLLAARLRQQGRALAEVEPMGRENVDCAARVAAIETAAQAVAGPLVLVAHSAGCLMVAHWARRTTRPVRGALLAVPPDFHTPMPEGYPGIEALRAAGWLPTPRYKLPFRCIVAASHDDPLAAFAAAAGLAQDWGAELADLGAVGHLNPASGYGPWPQAESLIATLSAPH